LVELYIAQLCPNLNFLVFLIVSEIPMVRVEFELPPIVLTFRKMYISKAYLPQIVMCDSFHWN